MVPKKKDIRALTKEQLREFFEKQGDKPYRGNQVYEWLWQKSAHSFEDMTNISLKTRDWIEKVHSYPVIAKELIKIYEELIH